MPALKGQMMSGPLMISSLLMHAARHHADTEIVSKRVEGDLHRTTWAGVERRARQAAQAFARLGCEAGDRIGTLAWNGYRHLEIYYGSSGSQLVCHTINPRLFPDQIAWIVNDAADRVLCFDLTFVALIEKLAPALKSVQHFVVMTDRAHMPADAKIPNLRCYDELLDAEDAGYAWPSFDENTASSICYTSGTTGNPKGAVYSHRSTILHAYAIALPDSISLSAADSVLPVVPMFHVNAWGLPYATALAGCRLVMPGPHLDGKSLYELFESERVNFSAGVPTVWLGLLNHVKSNGLKFSTFNRTVIGGSACPPAMIRTLHELGVEVIHAWGMTEMSPVGTLARLKVKHAGLDEAARMKLLCTQGRAVYGVDVAIVDDEGRALPWDGKTSGNLVVRGPWILERYYNHAESPLVSVDGQPGWFPTGDVAAIDADGYVQLTDRSKDVIKSGGEWISSIELENIAMAHPAVHEAAVIACRHPKWDERPLLVVVKKPDARLTREEILGFYEGRIAKWQVPDDVVFVTEIPHTATGKVRKLALREQFRDHVLG